MAEGVSSSGAVVDTGTYDDPEHPPAPDPQLAPKGWTWKRDARQWVPKVRGPLLAVAEPDLRQQVTQWVGAHAAAAMPLDEDQAPGADPGPGWQRDDPAPGPGAELRAIETFQLDRETRADIKALVALAYTVPSEALPLMDPYCFGPLAEKDTANGVIDAVSDIVCQSPKVARWAASASGLMPWIKLGKALQPVAVAAWHHHVVKDVEVTDVDRKAKTMKVKEHDWSQYPAA